MDTLIEFHLLPAAAGLSPARIAGLERDADDDRAAEESWTADTLGRSGRRMSWLVGALAVAGCCVVVLPGSVVLRYLSRDSTPRVVTSEPAAEPDKIAAAPESPPGPDPSTAEANRVPPATTPGPTSSRTTEAQESQATKSPRVDESDATPPKKPREPARDSSNVRQSQPPNDSEPPGTVVTLREPIAEAAFDDATGDLAVTTGAGKLFVYRAGYFDGDVSAVAGPIDVDARAPVAFKPFRGHTLLLVGQSGKLAVLDAKTMQPWDAQGRFANPVDFPDPTLGTPDVAPVSALAASPQPEDPFVYVERERYHFLFNLATGASRTPINLGSYGGHFSVSRSGRLVINSAGAIGLNVPFMGLPIIGSCAASEYPVAADPFDQFVATCHNGELWISGSGSVKRQDKFKIRPLLVLESRPFVVARDTTTLQIVGRNGDEIVAQVALPKSLHYTSLEKPPTAFGSFEDVRGNRVLLAQGDVVWLLPLDTLKLPDVPFLAAKLSLPIAVRPGEPISVPVEVADSRVKVSLAFGPEGAKLADGRLAWTPRRQDIGFQRLALRFEADGKSKEHEYPYLVGDVGMMVPFPPSGVAIGGDGRFAAIWNQRKEHPNQQFEATPQLCTVDLKERRVLAHREFARTLVSPCVVADQVFVRSGDSTLDVFRLSDLSPIRRLALAATGVTLQAYDDRLILAARGFGSPFRDGAKILRLPELTEVEPVRGKLAGDVARLPHGWSIGPAVVDETMQEVRFFYRHPPGALSLTGREFDGFVGISSRPARLPPVTNPTPVVPKPMQVVLNDRLHASLQFERAPQDQSNRVNLVFGKPPTPDAFGRAVVAAQSGPTVKIPVASLPANRSLESNAGLFGTGETLVLVLNGRIIPVSLAELGQEFPRFEPLVIEPTKTMTVLAPSGKSSLSFRASGGEPPYEFNSDFLLFQVGLAGTEIKDFVQKGAMPGTFTIDGGRLVRSITDDDSRFMNDMAMNAARGTESAANFVSRLAPQAQETLEPLLGRELAGVPVAVLLTIMVKDSAGQQAQLTLNLVLELPRAKLVEALNRKIPAKRRDLPKETAQPSPFYRFNQNAAAPRVANLPAFWPDKDRSIELSNRLRTTWPRVEPPKMNFERMATLLALDPDAAQFRDLPTTEERVWKLSNGKSVKGKFFLLHADALMVLPPSASQTEALNVDELTEESFRDMLKDRAVGLPGPRSLASFAGPLQAFAGQYALYPPQALVDKEGQPLVSWRVLMLPQLGYAPLFQLFHLDEPWDSPHNRKLIPFMPSVFKTIAEPLEAGRSNVLALVGPRAAFHEAPRRPDDIADPLHDTAFLVEVQADSAVEWTRPADLEVGDDAAVFDKLYRRTAFGKEVFLMLGAQGTLSAPTDVEREQLFRVVRIDDGPSGIKWER